MTDQPGQDVHTSLMMHARSSLAHIGVLILAAALVGPMAACSSEEKIPPAEPVSAKAAENTGALTSTDVSPTPTLTLTPEPTPTATPTITPSPTPRPGLPIFLRIPAIGVEAPIEHVGLTEELAMDVPSTTDNVAWYKLGYRPGERGNAVIAGHLDTVTGAPAVFWDLERLEPGDEIFVRGFDGVERRFVVDYHTRYPYDQAPVQAIFGPADVARLALITCNGEWDRATRNYSERVVLYASGAADSSAKK